MQEKRLSLMRQKHLSLQSAKTQPLLVRLSRASQVLSLGLVSISIVYFS